MKKTVLSIFFIFLFFISFANAEIINSPVNLNVGSNIDVHDFLFDPLLGTLNSITLEYNPVSLYVDYDTQDNNLPFGSGTFSGEFQYNLIFPVTNNLLGDREFSVGGNFTGEGEYAGPFGTMQASGSDTQTFTDPLILSFFTLHANDYKIGLFGDPVYFVVTPEVFLASGNRYHLATYPYLDGYMTATYDYEPIPEPSTIFLLFAGLISLTGFKNKFKVY
ncbi:MAG: PEP-CTERM sorting domain-containing protein [bacterium]